MNHKNLRSRISKKMQQLGDSHTTSIHETMGRQEAYLPTVNDSISPKRGKSPSSR
jgi:hypothetical protein